MALSSPFLSMFGRSPFRPLQKHINKAHECVKTLAPFFEAVLATNWDTAKSLQLTIAELEDQADSIKRDLRLHLPKGLFLPVSRGDILELLTAQDRLANKAEDIAGLVIGRQLIIPSQIATSFTEFLQRSIDASNQARKAINELDEVFESGFRGNEVKIIEEMINKLDAIEDESDDLQIVVREKLYAIENQLPPIDVMFLYEIINHTGDLADCAQSVGSRLELLLAH